MGVLRVQEMAPQIPRMKKDYTSLSQQRAYSLITPNSRICSIVSQSVGTPQAETVRPEVVQAFLVLFERTRIELCMQLEDIWKLVEKRAASGYVPTPEYFLAQIGGSPM